MKFLRVAVLLSAALLQDAAGAGGEYRFRNDRAPTLVDRTAERKLKSSKSEKSSKREKSPKSTKGSSSSLKGSSASLKSSNAKSKGYLPLLSGEFPFVSNGHSSKSKGYSTATPTKNPTKNPTKAPTPLPTPAPTIRHRHVHPTEKPTPEPPSTPSNITPDTTPSTPPSTPSNTTPDTTPSTTPSTPPSTTPGTTPSTPSSTISSEPLDRPSQMPFSSEFNPEIFPPEIFDDFDYNEVQPCKDIGWTVIGIGLLFEIISLLKFCMANEYWEMFSDMKDFKADWDEAKEEYDEMKDRAKEMKNEFIGEDDREDDGDEPDEQEEEEEEEEPVRDSGIRVAVMKSKDGEAPYFKRKIYRSGRVVYETKVNTRVRFTAEDANCKDYNWNYGDGNYTANGHRYEIHTYAIPKTYRVQLKTSENEDKEVELRVMTTSRRFLANFGSFIVSGATLIISGLFMLYEEDIKKLMMKKALEKAYDVYVQSTNDTSVPMHNATKDEIEDWLLSMMKKNFFDKTENELVSVAEDVTERMINKMLEDY